MQNIDLSQGLTRDATRAQSGPKEWLFTLGAAGGGVSLPGCAGTAYRYIIGDIEILEEHSVAMMLRFFVPGEEQERIFVRFGLLPGLKTRVCFDLEWLDNRSIYTNQTPGLLKLVVHGRRTDIRDVDRVELGLAKTFHDVRARFSDFYLSNERPAEFPVPAKKLVDPLGQWKGRDWPGKTPDVATLVRRLQALDQPAGFPFASWDRWGGDATRKLREGTGFFTTVKTGDGRWHLADPEGNEYFSLGPCCVRPGDAGRVDAREQLCDWLPPVEDPEFGGCYQIGTRQRTPYMEPESYKLFNYVQANLIRAFGEEWYEKWEEITNFVLKGHGLNTWANFSAPLPRREALRMPYVKQLPEFPGTETLIFRDFPDVLSEEYAADAQRCAQILSEWKDDPYLIGYFLRNEPEFNFVPDIILADEVLRHPAQTACRAGLIRYLRERYEGIDALNDAWGASFDSFEALRQPIAACSTSYPGAKADLRAYSAFLVEEYTRVPAQACRRVDPHHLNLGMRWSKADNPDMMAGWRYCDVFSINCYSFDPTEDLDFVMEAGVDLPVMIGEFHCGALDRGLPATGLKGVTDQAQRGVMWRHFVEKCAAHPLGAGAHWFQYNDQFCLGRFDGENYQIGLIDICLQPYPEMMEAILATSGVLYAVKNGEVAPFAKAPEAIPMIGY